MLEWRVAASAKKRDMKIWSYYLGPYLLGRASFRRKSRIENWLKENDRAIQICPIDLGISEGNSECNGIKTGTYQYLIACKKSSVIWQSKKSYFQPTATILDLSRFAGFDHYAATVSNKSSGNDNRAVKKALRLGYRTRVIDEAAYRASIDRIRRSKLFRSGGLMLDAVRPRAKLADGSEKAVATPSCGLHWSICWGVFKGDALAAYAVVTRCGNIIRTIHIMGHRDALHDGVIKLLMFDIIRWLYEGEAAYLRGIRHFMYGALEHGSAGLMEWKLRLQFHPSLLDMRSLYADNLPAGFDQATYLDLNPDVKKAGADARLHYMLWGKSEGRRYS
jgi:hypothetical protein